MPGISVCENDESISRFDHIYSPPQLRANSLLYIGMFVAARLLLGFGDCIVLGAAPLLIAEISHPQDRAILVTLSGASYHSGAFIASWTTYGTLQIPVSLKDPENDGGNASTDHLFRVTGHGDFLVYCNQSAP